MISFWRQLWHLLWKGCLVKRRQKKWLVAELVTPIILFAIIAFIRLRDFRVDGHECHFDSKGFPSAGLLPFTQSLLCSITNKCYDVMRTGDEASEINTDVHEQSRVVQTMRDLSQFFENVGENEVLFDDFMIAAVALIKWAAESNDTSALRFDKMFKNPSNVPQLLRKLDFSPELSEALAMSTITLTGFFGLFEYAQKHSHDDIADVLLGAFEEVPLFANQTLFEKSFTMPQNYSLTENDVQQLSQIRSSDLVWLAQHIDTRKIVSQLEKSGLNVEAVSTMVQERGKILSMFDPIVDIAELWHGFNANDKENVYKYIFCGKDPTNFNDSSNEAPSTHVKTFMDDVQEPIMNFVLSLTPGRDDRGNKTHCQDIPLHDDLECSLLENQVLRQLRPMLSGYILVTPDAPVVRDLVHKLENPLRQWQALLDTVKGAAGASGDFQTVLHNSTLAIGLENLLNLAYTEGFVSNATVAIFRDLLGPASDEKSLGTRAGEVLLLIDKYTKCFMADRFRIVANESYLEEIAMCLQPHQQYFSAIVFPELLPNATTLDDTTVYKIRHTQQLVDGTDSIADSMKNMKPRNNPLSDLKYLTFGFSFLQEAIDKAVIKIKTNKDPPIGIYAQQEPYPCIVTDSFDVSNMISLFVVLSWIIPAALLVKNVVFEKEHKLKELMRIMGLGDTIHFLSWAIISLVLNTLSVVLITVILWVGNILGHTEPTLIFSILMLFALSSIALSLLLTTFFTNSNIATAATATSCLLLCFPAMLSKSIKSSLWAKITLMFPQSAVSYAMIMLAKANKEEEAKWSDVNRMQIDQFDVHMTEVFIAFVAHIVVFSILAWYISALFPGVYGVGQRWYFPFTLKYWAPKRIVKYEFENSPDETYDESLGFEAEPKEGKYCVHIQKLSKIYKNNVRALDELSLRLYEGQITALLGHNGAGKTTTMSLLCGLYGPSSGTAMIYGNDIRTDIRQVRDVLGICPQHNVLFAHLTVEEQLQFYAALKGMRGEDLMNEVHEILESVSLTDKRETLAATLSGGMKRRLSIGIALIGGSKFVILDEPTAGVDVNSRKEIWKLLLKNKVGRTILLSTHHMDEADVLADRIAILSEGKLKALGSSVFLKRKHGHSYKLTLMRDRDAVYNTPLMEPPSLDDLANVKCTAIEATEDELVYSLPIDAPTEVLERFFEVLDKKMPELHCIGYGIQAPSLQQIFVDLAPQSGYHLAKVKGRLRKFFDSVNCCCPSWKNNSVEDIEHLMNPFDTSTQTESTRSAYTWQDSTVPVENASSRINLAHVRALFAAKVLYVKRSWLTIFFQIVLPILLLCCAELYAKYVGNPKAYGRWSNLITAPPLVFSSALFGDGAESYISIHGPRVNDSWPHRIIETFEQPPGIGVRCLPYTINEFNPTCYRAPNAPNDTFSFFAVNSSVPYNEELTCGCHYDTGWSCTQEDYPIDELPTFVSVNTTDIIRDLSYRNVSQFRLVTRFSRSYEDAHPFIGGWTMGHENMQALNASRQQNVETGLHDVFHQISNAGLELGLNSSLWSGNSTQMNDTFAANYTFEDVVSNIFAGLDTQQNIKVWFNNKVWPSLPIYCNAVSNAILRAFIAENSNLAQNIDDIGIVTYNHPMNRTAEDSFDNASLILQMMFRIVLLIFVLCSIPASFSSFLVTDRESHSMHLQLVSGLKRKMYWSVEYIFDFLIYMISSISILVLYAIIGVPELTYNFSTALCFLTLFLVFGFVALLMVLVLQRFFAVPSLAFVLISIGLFFVGVVTSMTVIFIEQLMRTDDTLVTAYNVCLRIFTILVPQFNLGIACYRGGYVYQVFHFASMMLDGLNRADMVSKIPLPHLMQWEIMGQFIVALICQGIVFLVIFCVLENDRIGFFRQIERLRTSAVLQKSRVSEDSDVEREKERVRLITERTDEKEHSGLVVRDIAKAYGSHLAVKGVSFAVAPGECFGLLGLNGAGKTTTFAMLTGKHSIGHGEVEVAGYRVAHCASEGFRHLGYCPQFDALNMKLTTAEQLRFYARIRGVVAHRVEGVVSSLLSALHLAPYADVLTADLSGGNKRKLSVAVALVSQPPVILLDEPSAGMDPGSQQFLWMVVTALRKAGKAVVLTSHSMEECEALCTRIAIMDNGRVRCIGSKQHLKTKFGEGYTLTLKTASVKGAHRAAELIVDTVKGAKVSALHCATLFVHIPEGSASVAEVLNCVNKIKSDVCIEDFALSQTTLDDIFHLLSASSALENHEGEAATPPAPAADVDSSSKSAAVPDAPPSLKPSTSTSSHNSDFVPADPAPSNSLDESNKPSLEKAPEYDVHGL